MRQTLAAFLVSLLLISGCRKSNTSSLDLSGSWKLIQVFDKNTATTSFPPAGSNRDVVIAFTNGRFYGHTLMNSFTDGTFTLNGDKITFGAFAMTKVAEDQWGGVF